MNSKIVRSFTSFSRENSASLLNDLSTVHVAAEDIDAFNRELYTQIKEVFKNVMRKSDVNTLSSLLEVLCDCTQSDRTCVKKQVVIDTLDDVLDCVGIADLKTILEVIGQKIGRFGHLEDKNCFKLWRILNLLLKRISKTEDYALRGQLHMTLSKILTLCHDSGFNYKTAIARYVELQDNDKNVFQDYDIESSITIQFFEEFWELQKYFMDVEEVAKSDVANSGKPDSPQLIPNKLRRIELTLIKTIDYFHKNPVTHNNTFLTYPINYLKLPNLLTLQLQDSYFRLNVMIQAKMYCYALQNPTSRYASTVRLTNDSKEIVARLKRLAEIEIEDLMKNYPHAEGKSNLPRILDVLLRNEQYWIELKENWKERKKTFFRSPSPQIMELKRKVKNPDSEPLQLPEAEPGATIPKPINLAERQRKVDSFKKKKFRIDNEAFQQFLEYEQVPSYCDQPKIPSFAYHFEIADACLEGFDYEQKCQTEFESETKYNFFEWKAFRSLYQQKIRDIKVDRIDDKNSNSDFSDYALLKFLNSKAEELYENPRKKVKMSSPQSNPGE